MIDETLFKSDYLGKDGFIWWLGQVAPANAWKAETLHRNFNDVNKADKNWPERCKVRIIGYHTFKTKELKDTELPWAHVMMDPAFGSAQGGEGITHNLKGGEVCFGFFLDGNDAQQPIVVGVIHRNAKVKNEAFTSKDYLINEESDFAFRPFTGHPGNVPSTKKEIPPPTPAKEAPSPIPKSLDNLGIGFTDGGYTFDPTQNLGVAPLNIKDYYGDKLVLQENNSAYLAFLKKTSVTYVPPDPCNNNFIGQITRALQDFIAFTNGIHKFADTYIDPVLNEIVDIGNEIKSIARSIGGIIRLIINSIRGTLFKCIIKLYKDFIGVLTDPQQTVISQSVKNILNIIFCIFEKLMPFILELIESLLGDMVDSVFNAPICAVEQWTAAILTQVMDTVEKSVDTILSGISWLTGGLTNIFNILNQASSLASAIYNFIGCDGLKCNTPSSWSSNFGPTQEQADNWGNMVGKINVFKGTSEGLGSIENAIAGLSLYNQGSSYQACNDIVNNPKSQNDLSPQLPGVVWKNCIPPIVSVYGDGLGAKLTPIVGNNGSIISIEINSGGIGYTYPPVLNIIDKSRYGSKSTAIAFIDSDGKIIKVLVTNGGKGYCKGDYQGNDDPNFDILLTSSKTEVYEGDSFIISIQSFTLPENTEIRYKITGVNSTDIKQNIEGVLVLKGSSASIMIDTLVDDVVNYKELVFNLIDYNKSLSVFIQDISNSDSNKDKSYQLFANNYEINEGTAFNINLITQNIKDNTLVPFTISGYSEGVIQNANSYSDFEVINNKSSLKFKTKKGIINKNEIFKLELKNGKASVGVLIKLITSTGISTNPDVCVNELVVIRPGIGYTLGDTATDGVNTYYPIISPINGSIVKVKPLTYPVCGFNDIPNITINTNTGNGAEIMPVMALNKNLSSGGAFNTNSNSGIGNTVINVVDCV